MRIIRNDKKNYRTRESLSSPPKREPVENEPKLQFTFEVVGHYLKRSEK